MDEDDFYDPVQDTLNWEARLVGRQYVFEDGDRLEVLQVKRRETGPWVTYCVYQGPGIPRKMVMHIDEFNVMYGHLFE